MQVYKHYNQVSASHDVGHFLLIAGYGSGQSPKGGQGRLTDLYSSVDSYAKARPTSCNRMRYPLRRDFPPTSLHGPFPKSLVDN